MPSRTSASRAASATPPRARLVEARVLERLRLQDLRAELPLEALREARLLALVGHALSLSGAELSPSAGAFRDEVTLLAEHSGLSIPATREARERLLRSGVWEEVAGTSGWLRLSEGVLEQGLQQGPDWARVLERVLGESATLLSLWALAELLRHPGRWGTVAQRDLCRYSGYSKGMVIRGLARAVEAGLVETDGGNGRRSAYRFTAYAMGTAESPAPLLEPEPPLSDEPRASTPPAPPPAVQAPAPGTVRMQIGGVDIELPAGTRVSLIRDAEGRSYFQLGEHWRIGPLP